jgi:glycosyltransferase involved in cell wall biosynthesis
VTLSAAPVANVLAHVFGAGATEALVVGGAGASGDAITFSRADGAPTSLLNFDPTAFANVARFVDGETFDRLRGAHRAWLMSAAAVLLQFEPNPHQIDDLVSGGFGRSRHFPTGSRRTTVFIPEKDGARPARDSVSRAGGPDPTRLVIVDPCLGRAAGHYEAYARMLTNGARDLGLRVAWACHMDLDANMAPADVDVRRCFQRCFFDLRGDEPGMVDLSPELFESWTRILAEFDEAGAHILVHSADAHQLRAAAAVFEKAPPQRAVVHMNFQTSPRFMPGRLAGGDVHAAVLRLRNTPAWERSLFFWAETRRLASWLSDWLAEEIPAPPFLSDWRGAASVPGKSGGPITLAFLGEGRASKGFLDLPDIADHIAARPLPGGGIRLAIQNWPPFRGDLARHETAVARLSRLPFVEIVEGVLDPPAYEALLDEADILLLPYDPQSYGLQGSGILVEGLARGKIIIARAGTAVIDEARVGVGFAYRTPEALAEGLPDIVGAFPDLAATAAGLAERFRENNSPRRFVRALAARAGYLAWRR